MSTLSRALLGSVLVPALALPFTAPSAQAATAPAVNTGVVPVGLGPWAAPKELPGVTAVIDLKSARNGTLAALFTQGGETVLSVRPAGSGTWQSAKPAPGATLQRTDDGALSLLWWVTASDGVHSTLRMSRLAPDATAFGPAEDVVTGTLATDWFSSRARVTTIAANAAGRQAVAWMDGDHRLTVVERPGPQGAWSAPVTLDRLPDPIVRDDNTYVYTLRDLRLAVAGDGALAVVWGGNSFYTGDGVDPDPTAYKWHYKYLEKPAGAGAWAAPRDLPQLGEKPDQVALAAHPQGGFHLLSRGDYARKPAGAADWGTAQSTGVDAGGSAPAELFTAPNGDVTAVGSGSPVVATRLASRGTWGAARQLNGYAEKDSVSSTQTAAGSVVVTYTQKRFELGSTIRRDFVAQTLAGGSVSKPRTLNVLKDGTSSAGRVATDDKGRPLAVWTQSADDGSSRSSFTATTGTRALPKWHDYADHTRSDVLGTSLSDAMNLFTQDTADPVRTFQVRPWAEETRIVSFGDFDGDRCNDLVVRLPGGEARLYTPVCGGLPAPDSAYRRLSQDWSAYDTVLSSGDQTGDGKPDLLARVAATGNVYLYAHNGTTGFLPRVKIRSAWTGYKRLIGAGDLNGDGIGDVLALDKSGELWRYNGTGTGTLKDRVLVFKDWGESYKEVIGAGDFNGDGRNDLVSRDTSNRLWLNAGTGTGTFTNRVQAGDATYWKSWASLA
ncbi:FG-GAP repeat domain-containing protein [Streptomyces sp. NPDC059909]|uniref:FG-GAP repeat domain-containing protein n=1 Tax=Streptomyces sp. NPDC059909 TaxID=3346998 RepID=UPI0036543D87